MNQPVSIQFQGHPISGVIEHVDDEHVYLLVLGGFLGALIGLFQGLMVIFLF